MVMIIETNVFNEIIDILSLSYLESLFDNALYWDVIPSLLIQEVKRKKKNEKMCKH